MKLYGVTELQSFVGRIGKYRVNGLSFDVVVADAHTNFNILEYLVRPVAGEGEAWISASFITLDDPVEVTGVDK